MRKFILVPVGHETLTREVMDAWTRWFESIREHVVDSGNPFGEVRGVTRNGIETLQRDHTTITGYIIIKAMSMDDAVRLIDGCPIVTSMRIYEIGSMEASQ